MPILQPIRGLLFLLTPASLVLWTVPPASKVSACRTHDLARSVRPSVRDVLACLRPQLPKGDPVRSRGLQARFSTRRSFSGGGASLLATDWFSAPRNGRRFRSVLGKGLRGSVSERGLAWGHSVVRHLPRMAKVSDLFPGRPRGWSTEEGAGLGPTPRFGVRCAPWCRALGVRDVASIASIVEMRPPYKVETHEGVGLSPG